MKVEVAQQWVANMQAAINRAVAEGRDELERGDLEAFVAADDAARAELVAAIGLSQD